ncbi:aureochrome1-like protein [Phytophthora cinnamomi]|uniref:aureochrome1-like protein n=1 Tax=Phytophthora cinnamomi TaxID=4785 RepID=UPI0035594505|nr:aureochrome1-like protein [Phytophthora cinnamomi]
MSIDYGVPIVLPPIGPLFASSGSPTAALLAYESEEQREQYEEDMARYFGVPLPSYMRRRQTQTQTPQDDEQQHEEPANLRTPTSASSFAPSSSPVRKDGAKTKTALPLLQLDSPTHTDGSATELSSASPSGEEEKLRVSRERNRLHAQRTRIRKRELLESLKERIEALQDEFELLRQAYDFHATAVCLLRLGNVVDVPCVLKLEQVGINATEDRDEDGQLCEAPAHDSDADADHEDAHEHEKGCACHGKDAAPSDACTCIGAQLNANGKRPYAAASSSAAGSSSNMLVCSKEERERVRRERNRLHARRARLRKKMVLEKSQQAVHDLRERNDRLRSRLSVLVSSIYGSEACLDDPDATS